MNKYQEALDRLNILTGEPIQVFKTGERMILGLREVAVLQELVDRATPKKIEDIFDVYEDFVAGFCVGCDAMVGNSDNYCSDCGQKIDWGDND